ncbi:SDR family NAD(P)-dependent oxidoreductase [Candidatus Puniceispirillum sp.]|uniref:SDR family NAD(P)-dependent oxidoreductase n=1 Tax=Candidatus Puniceispirillum sp. TaxID=2026719 RepID=UPI001ED5A1E3|nr:SDR family NAD(P)-dependent oxidoreductase [Candidatus Puniceispirillum sp.]
MRHYFITGVSSGIGAALVSALSPDANITGVARRQDRLDALSKKHAHFHPIAADVTDAKAMRTAVKEAIKTFGPIDVAILNAGIYTPQDGNKIDPAVYHQHMNVNYMGVVNTLAPIVTNMITQKQGHIAITSSVAGWRGLPKSAAYGPTKAALISLAESLYFDLTPRGIKLQVICPGFVESEATAVNDFKMPDLLSSDQAAAHILSGLKHDNFIVDFPKSFTRKMKFLKYLPDRLFFKFVARQTGHN